MPANLDHNKPINTSDSQLHASVAFDYSGEGETVVEAWDNGALSVSQHFHPATGDAIDWVYLHPKQIQMVLKLLQLPQVQQVTGLKVLVQ